MSVAYDYAIIPDADVDEPVASPRPRLRVVPDYAPAVRRRRGPAVPSRVSSTDVAVLHPPVELASPAPLRLTQRGRLVLAAAVAVLGVVFVAASALSAPSGTRVPSMPARVTVQPGDTLWSIASRIAPASDPRAVVAQLQQRNHLTGVGLVPGEVLRAG